VVLKVRFADFTTITRSRTLRDPTDVSRDIYVTARALFDGLGLQRARVRLVGVRLEGLVEPRYAALQPRLDDPDQGWREADRAVDQASARFGAGVVRPASLVPEQSAPHGPPEAPGPARTSVRSGETDPTGSTGARGDLS
jgi:DNA polymerase-4